MCFICEGKLFRSCSPFFSPLFIFFNYISYFIFYRKADHSSPLSQFTNFGLELSYSLCVILKYKYISLKTLIFHRFVEKGSEMWGLMWVWDSCRKISWKNPRRVIQKHDTDTFSCHQINKKMKNVWKGLHWPGGGGGAVQFWGGADQFWGGPG